MMKKIVVYEMMVYRTYTLLDMREISTLFLRGSFEKILSFAARVLASLKMKKIIKNN